MSWMRIIICQISGYNQVTNLLIIVLRNMLALTWNMHLAQKYAISAEKIWILLSKLSQNQEQYTK